MDIQTAINFHGISAPGWRWASAPPRSPCARRVAARLARPTEEWMLVLQGRMEIKVGEETHVLGPGDSIHYDGESLREFALVGDGDLLIVCSITPPAHPESRLSTIAPAAGATRFRLPHHRSPLRPPDIGRAGNVHPARAGSARI